MQSFKKNTIEEERRRRKRKRSAMPSTEPGKLYLILPSYAEQHKADINMIIAKEKTKFCSNAFYKNIFDNVEFRIAFANRRNIKKMIARTKIKNI